MDAQSRSQRVLSIVECAGELPQAQRAAYVQSACAGDEQLAAEVSELLALDDGDPDPLPSDARGFIDRFRRELDNATRHAAVRVRHTELLEHLLADLRRHGARIDRFEIKERLGRGGMGEVFRALDRLLRRDVALKRVRASDGSSEAPDPGKQIRFLQEAQVVAQLDHPNIPTVHELGIDDHGRLFFTMPLVAGESLAQMLASLPSGTRRWEQPRILEGLLRAAQALAHAHERGVIHRDLKPANLMLGRFGSMQVMDWGIARVVDEERAREVLYGPQSDPAVTSDLSHASQSDPAFETVAGSALGTPSYMSPEQALCDRTRIGPATDVYSLGAILYEVLTGAPAYTHAAGGSSEPSLEEILERVRSGPPTPVAKLAPEAPAELVAICERAMQRKPERRFASAQAMARDLEAYLSGRVVRSYERGVWPEMRKWVRRNRGLAGSIAAALLVAVLGATGIVNLRARSAVEAREKQKQVLRLTAREEMEALERKVASLWPARPALLPALEEWRSQALDLVGRLNDLERHRTELEARAQRSSDGEWTFSNPDDAILQRQLDETIAGLRQFKDPERGPLYGSGRAFGPGVVRRMAWAQAEQERAKDPTFARIWAEACAGVAASPRYGGVQLVTDGDLLPLGENPRTGLWEFALLTSGTPPASASGGWSQERETGLVFVLIPGSLATVGSQREDPGGTHWFEHTAKKEQPPHAVLLAPYYLSKYELTHAQWERIAGYAAGSIDDPKGTLPVESVNWNEAGRVLAYVDLVLPTEAQWEHAARGGTSTPWWTGSDATDLFLRENVSWRGLSAEVESSFEVKHGPIPDIESAPVPVYEGLENPFGMKQMLGNVLEWCRDSYGAYDQPVAARDGERNVLATLRVRRGGHYATVPFYARSSRRSECSADVRSILTGVRPARLARIEE